MSLRAGHNGTASASVANFLRHEEEATAAQTVVTLPFILTTNTLVMVNGVVVPSADYSGTGTLTLTFAYALALYDNIVVIG